MFRGCWKTIKMATRLSHRGKEERSDLRCGKTEPLRFGGSLDILEEGYRSAIILRFQDWMRRSRMMVSTAVEKGLRGKMERHSVFVKLRWDSDSAARQKVREARQGNHREGHDKETDL